MNLVLKIVNIKLFQSHFSMHVSIYEVLNNLFEYLENIQTYVWARIFLSQ